jgi:hypothetical protein
LYSPLTAAGRSTTFAPCCFFCSIWPIINHPNFFWAVTAEDLLRVENLRLMEVFNGHPNANNVGGGGLRLLDEMWDVLLTAGRRIHGIAVDDAHNFKRIGREFANPGKGWIQVHAESLTPAAIRGAIEQAISTPAPASHSPVFRSPARSTRSKSSRRRRKSPPRTSSVKAAKSWPRLSPRRRYIASPERKSTSAPAWNRLSADPPGPSRCSAARSLSEKCGFRTLSRYPSRSTDSHTSSGADTGFGHVALSAFSEAKLTENDAPGCLGTATEAY